MTRPDPTRDEGRADDPDIAEPVDLDDFWARTLDEARNAPAAPASRSAISHPFRLVEIDDLTFPGFGGEPVRAWFVRPRDTGERRPAVVEFVGYGRGRGLPHERLHWAAAGFGQLIVDTRGQGAQWGTGGQTPDPHGAGPATPGFLTRGIEDPREYYYRRVFTDAVRAVDAVRTLPEIDPDRVAVTGNSQGGAIAIAAAALCDGLIAALPTAPILCDVRRVVPLIDTDPLAEISRYLAVQRGAEQRVFETLAYFDGALLASRATAPALFGCGLRDTIAPPSGVFAAYHRWGGPKTMIEYPWNGHEGGEGLHQERQVAWLADLLGRDAAAGVRDGR